MFIIKAIKSYFSSLIEFFNIESMYKAKRFDDRNKIFMIKKIYSHIKSKISNIKDLYKFFGF